MQKKIEQIGLFLTKSEHKPKNDKRIKCIYKNEKAHTKNENKKHKEAKNDKVSANYDQFVGDAHKCKPKKHKERHAAKLKSHSPSEVRTNQKSKEIPKNVEGFKEKPRKSKHLEKRQQNVESLNEPISDSLTIKDIHHQTPSELKFFERFYVLNRNFEEDKTEASGAHSKQYRKKQGSSEKNLQRKSKLQAKTRNYKTKEQEAKVVKNDAVIVVDPVKCISTTQLKYDEITKKNKSPRRLTSSKKNVLSRRKRLHKTSFCVVHIPSVVCSGARLEERRNFKKYYKYNCVERTSQISACNKFSDSNKLYQITSEEFDNTSIKLESDIELQNETKSLVDRTVSRTKNTVQNESESLVNQTISKSKNRAQNESESLVDQTISKSKNKAQNVSKLLVDQTISRLKNKAQIESESLVDQTISRSKKKASNLENNNKAEPLKKKSKSKRSLRSLRLEPNVSVFTIDGSCKIQPVDEIPSKQKNNLRPKSRIPIMHKCKEDNTETCSKPAVVLSNANTNKSTEKYELDDISDKKTTPKTSEHCIFSTVSKSETRAKRVCNKKPRKTWRTRKFAAKSISNSTFGDKSIDSEKNVTSLLLTKTYRDDDKMRRYYKRKNYSDALRNNWIGKGSKKKIASPEVVEVRFLTVTTHNNSDFNAGTVLALPESNQVEVQQEQDYLSDNDLPNHYTSLDETWEIQELDNIISENYSFLQKKFSLDVQPLNFDNLSISTVSNCEEQMTPLSVSITSLDVESSHSTDNFSKTKTITSQTNTDQISDESGYSSIKSNFFDRLGIQKLFIHPPSIECLVELEDNVLSGKDLHICSIESKSLQTISIAYSQKSVQVKLSEEELTDLIDFSDPQYLENTLSSVEVPGILKVQKKRVWNRLITFCTTCRKVLTSLLCITKSKKN